MVFLIACVVVGLVFGFGGGTMPVDADDCQHDDGGDGGGWSTETHCHGESFDDDENRVCDTGDPGYTSDQDGDGTFDCFDNDNDGDLLTDELEYKTRLPDGTKPYDMNAADNDADLVRDDWDILPGNSDDWIASVDVGTLDLADSGCDGGGSEPADPYIRHHDDGETTFSVKFGADSSTGFKAASERLLDDPWTEADGQHPDNPTMDPFDPGWTLDARDDDVLDPAPGDFDNHQYSLPDNVSDYGVPDVGDQPAIQLTLGLQDHDEHVGGDDEEIDLGDGAPLDAALTYDLRLENPEDASPKPISTTGDATCFAMVEGLFNDEIPQEPNDNAVYRASNPNTMIYTDTV